MSAAQRLQPTVIVPQDGWRASPDWRLRALRLAEGQMALVTQKNRANFSGRAVDFHTWLVAAADEAAAERRAAVLAPLQLREGARKDSREIIALAEAQLRWVEGTGA